MSNTAKPKSNLDKQIEILALAKAGVALQENEEDDEFVYKACYQHSSIHAR